MKFLSPVILQLAGVGVIFAEILLPSAGILTLLAICIFGYSLYLVFSDVSIFWGWIFMMADLIIVPVLVVYGFKFLERSPLTLVSALSREDGVSSQEPDMDGYIGLTGTALSDLRPSGVALLGDKRADVVTRGEYIEKGTPIVVEKVTGNQIIVKKQTVMKEEN
jgi:membrane-bound serine protease (ClpP class)